MRISKHGNDLLVTDQSLGFGAALVSLGVLLCVSPFDHLFAGGSPVQTLLTGVFGVLGIMLGLRRLSATQLIVDPDEKVVTTRQWSFMGTQVQRFPYHDVQRFEILPEGQDRSTQLMIRTSSGLFPALGNVRAVSSAWREVIAAIEERMQC